MLLQRIAHTNHGTFGVLSDAGVPFAITLEQVWRENRVNVSCIPCGEYRCVRVASPRFGDTFEVTAVPGRSAILFHKGNLVGDTAGCILIGEQFGVLDGVPAVLASGPGFGEFLAKLRGMNAFPLTIG